MKKVLITIIVLLLIVVLGIGAYFVWRLNEKIDEQGNQLSTLIDEVKGKKENNTAENNVTNNTVNNTTTTNTTNTTNTVTTTTTATTDEEKIKEAYLKKIKQTYQNCTDFRIDSVKVLTAAEKEELVKTIPEYKDVEILAVVVYSIKPASMDTFVLAGNGEVSGDWVINKSACVSYKDGTILSDGTGW